MGSGKKCLTKKAKSIKLKVLCLNTEHWSTRQAAVSAFVKMLDETQKGWDAMLLQEITLGSAHMKTIKEEGWLEFKVIGHLVMIWGCGEKAWPVGILLHRRRTKWNAGPLCGDKVNVQ